MVKRWLATPTRDIDAVKLIPMDGGGPDFFVKAADYDALAAELAKLRAGMVQAFVDRFRLYENRFRELEGLLGEAQKRMSRLACRDWLDENITAALSIGSPQRDADGEQT